MPEPDDERVESWSYFEAQNKILEALPGEFRQDVGYFAYQKQHAGGSHEILEFLKELVEMLGPPIKSYTERIRKEETTP